MLKFRPISKSISSIKPWGHTLKVVITDTYRQMNQAQLFLVASSLAYNTILSIIPALALSFAVFQAFGGLQKLYNLLRPIVLSNLAEGTSDEVIATIQKFVENAHSGALGVGGMIGLIITTLMLLSSVENAINLVWQVKLTRTVFQRIAYYWIFITLGPLALSVAIGVATTYNWPLASLLPSGTGLFVVSIGIFFAVYKWVPQTKVKWQFALLSGFVTAVLWNLARLAYGLYTKNVVTYNVVYGSLGAIPILLVWIYIVWLIILGGAALTAALQKRIKT